MFHPAVIVTPLQCPIQTHSGPNMDFSSVKKLMFFCVDLLLLFECVLTCTLCVYVCVCVDSESLSFIPKTSPVCCSSVILSGAMKNTVKEVLGMNFSTKHFDARGKGHCVAVL